MAWRAKPYGGYDVNTTAARENITEISRILTEAGYTLECQAGIIGNMMAESGLNPWRWQGDVVNLAMGYGLAQYTPASGYIEGARGLAGYGPNMSITSQTAGARPEDGQAQLTVFVNDLLQKWVSYCWRPYWDTAQYADLYAVRQTILTTWGDGSRLTQQQFSGVDDVYYSTFAFLACFEGPSVPNMSARYANAVVAYQILTGLPPGPGPGPIPSFPKKLPIWLYIKQL